LITKILVLDDEYKTATIISDYLTIKGNKVDIATSYQRGITFFQKSYDVLIADVLLKDDTKTGLDFAYEYKNNHPHTFVIAMSGNKSFRISNDIIDCFLEKPIDLKKMGDIIKSHVNTSLIDLIEKIDTISIDIKHIKNKLEK
jgi:DNA-binding NtrC family response regulator